MEEVNTPEETIERIRELMFRLKDTKHWSWKYFKNKMNKNISESSYDELEELQDHNQWRKIQSGEVGESYPIEWWNELEVALEELGGATQNLTGRKNGAGNKSKAVKSIGKKVVRFGVFFCQDTILPLFFEVSYKRKLRIKWIGHKNWSDGLNALKSGDVDVVLHNFSTALAHNISKDAKWKLIFIPYFYFTGYGLLIKKEDIEKFGKSNGLKKADFSMFNPAQKKKFFEQANAIVERKTDFEWAYKNYCLKFECDPTLIDKHIFDSNTNYGKDQFVKNSKYSVYCTNPIHIFDLIGKKHKGKYLLVADGNTMTDHANFNGLICDEKFYKENRDIIDELNEVWFNVIDFFLDDIKDATKSDKTSKKDSPFYFTVTALIEFLNRHTNSEISPNDLREVFEGYNNFYPDEESAFEAFYEGQLNDKKMVENYCGIAQTQMGKSNDTDKIKNAINELKETMVNSL